MHRLKEFLNLAVSALMSRSNLVHISLIFDNQRWIGTFGKDNGLGVLIPIGGAFWALSCHFLSVKWSSLVTN